MRHRGETGCEEPALGIGVERAGKSKVPNCLKPAECSALLRKAVPVLQVMEALETTEQREAMRRTFGVPPEPLPSGDLATRSPGQSARSRAELEWQRRRAEKPIRAVLGRLMDAHTDERAWRIGADGEVMVGRELARVAQREPRWRFLHAIPVGDHGSDIDHIAIGPAGVFTINAKHHPEARVWVGGGTFIVNGNRVPYIRNSRYEAQRAARMLSNATATPVPVFGLIVPVRCRNLTVKTPPVGVAVIPQHDLVRWFLSLPAQMCDQRIATIFEAARRPSTWA